LAGERKGVMMATEIRLRNPATGDEKIAYRGYSWTSFFFAAFPTLLRGDIAIGLAVFAVTVLVDIAFFFAGLPTWLGTGLVGGIWGFFYNEIHLKRLLRAGYEVAAGLPAAAS
jgi:hypothetical protein